MAQHHFVVMYDPSVGWTWDTDTEESNFQGCVYLTDREEWVNSSYSNEINEIDNQASDQLIKAIQVMNGTM